MPAWAVSTNSARALRLRPGQASGPRQDVLERLLLLPLRMLVARAPRPGLGQRRAGGRAAARTRACHRCRRPRCVPAVGRSRIRLSSWSGRRSPGSPAWPTRCSTTVADRPSPEFLLSSPELTELIDAHPADVEGERRERLGLHLSNEGLVAETDSHVRVVVLPAGRGHESVDVVQPPRLRDRLAVRTRDESGPAARLNGEWRDGFNQLLLETEQTLGSPR